MHDLIVGYSLVAISLAVPVGYVIIQTANRVKKMKFIKQTNQSMRIANQK